MDLGAYIVGLLVFAPTIIHVAAISSEFCHFLC